MMRPGVAEHSSENKAIVPPKFFPHCIVWSPIPVVTWLIPFIGHLGVCTTDGTVFDFAGGVNVGQFAFGHATKFLQLEPLAASALAPMPQLHTAWNRAIHYSEGIFNQRMYSFCGNNCHRFVAHFLEQVRFAKRHHWSQVRLLIASLVVAFTHSSLQHAPLPVWILLTGTLFRGWLMFFHGHNVSTAAALKTYLPFVLLLVLSMVFLNPLYTLFIWSATVLLLVVVLHACDVALRSYEGHHSDADLGMHGPPPYCWSSVGAPDVLVATPARPSEFLVQRPKVQRRVAGATVQSLSPSASPAR